MRMRRSGTKGHSHNSVTTVTDNKMTDAGLIYKSLDHRGWRRVLLLVIAITVHNIPEGLAVGVSFGAVGKSDSATFEKARNLAIGIGIQNFPEGLAVSLPLAAFGYSKIRSFIYGQLSGMVEPVFAVIGALCVNFMQSVLPFALAFAAGAMVYVVFDDVIPEAHSRHSSPMTTWMVIL
ncbi:unnamed protein product, partial [Soboliphyme baturini]|uniref:Zinc transporter ZIP11 n=1 Tax=Soboliphyme baturini TaxID=241478 RepID=A0A183JBE3_9BILA